MGKSIGIVGGTGDIGEGLCVRFVGAGHEVHVGSRESEKGEKAAEKYSERVDAEIEGGSNTRAVENAETVVLGVPYGYAVETVEKLDLREKTVVSPVVSMSREESFVYDEPGSGSAAEEIKEVLPETASLAGAFHNVAAGRLADPDAELGVDIAVFGDEDAKDETLELIETVEGMRGLDVGGFEVAPQVEAITPLLINVGMKNGMKDLGIRFV